MGNAGEFLGLTGARLNGKELVAVGLATHFVPLEVIFSLFTIIFSSTENQVLESWKDCLKRFENLNDCTVPYYIFSGCFESSVTISAKLISVFFVVIISN